MWSEKGPGIFGIFSSFALTSGRAERGGEDGKEGMSEAWHDREWVSEKKE